MKYTLSTKSWHFWVACFLNNRREVLRKETICSYRWSVIFGMMRLFVVSSLVSIFFIAPFVVSFLGLFIKFTKHVELLHNSWLALAIEATVACIIFLCIQISNWLEARKDKRRAEEIAARQAGTWKDPEPTPPKEPGFVKTAWHSLKNKYCLPIEFNEKDSEVY